MKIKTKKKIKKEGLKGQLGYWEATGRLLGGYWEATARLLFFFRIRERCNAHILEQKRHHGREVSRYLRPQAR